MERKVPDRILSARISQNRPVANNQWQISLKLEDGDFPDFAPGNFCMISVPTVVDPLIPRPFAIVDRKDGVYSFIYRVTGKQTKALTNLPTGFRLDVTGPLGKGFKRDSFEAGEHIFVAGGVGYASLLPLIDCLGKNAKASLFYGVRTDMEVIRKGPLVAEFASDDGSIGFKGRLHDLLKAKTFSPEAKFYVCGPTPMMRAMYPILPPERSFYFLEETMGCGFGICVGCVVGVDTPQGLKNVKSCLDGCMFQGSSLQTWAGGSH